MLFQFIYRKISVTRYKNNMDFHLLLLLEDMCKVNQNKVLQNSTETRTDYSQT